MTALGEAALAQLATRCADYRTLLRLSAGTRDEQRGRHLTDGFAGRHGNALTDLVAVVEHFSVVRLLNLRPTVTPEQVGQWKGRVAAWKQHGGVDLATFPDWQAFMGFVQVRNALAHGLGRLTEWQLAKHRTEVLKQVAAAGVPLYGDLVLVTTRDVHRCARTSEELVRFVDLTAPQH
jgi:hypothetical protein